MEGEARIAVIICLLIVLILIIILFVFSMRHREGQEERKPYFIRSRHTLEYLVPRNGKLYASARISSYAVWYEIGAPGVANSGFFNIATGRFITRNGTKVTVGSSVSSDVGTVFTLAYSNSNLFALVDPVTGLVLTVGDDFYCYLAERVIDGSDDGRQLFELESAL